MPHGVLSGCLHELTSQILGNESHCHDNHAQLLYFLSTKGTRRIDATLGASNFLASPQTQIRTSFQETAADRVDDEEAAANAAQAVTEVAQQANASLESGKAAVPKKGKPQAWDNTDGLPTVTLVSPADSYVSRDIADSVGESNFRPNLGCKCDDWRPAPSHPQIEFREPFLASHPDFVQRVRKLHLHMTDTTDPADPKVHWDATYDLKKYADPKLVAEGKLKLEETYPAEEGSGSQLRFLTFCPPEMGPAHTYELKVSALDQNDNPIDYFQDHNSTYSATPPAPEDENLIPGTAGTLSNPAAKAEIKRAQGQLHVAEAQVRAGEQMLNAANQGPAEAR